MRKEVLSVNQPVQIVRNHSVLQFMKRWRQ